MKKTKIIATIGPASSTKETLRDMINNGMNIARINMTHADHTFCDKVIKTIRELNKDLNKNVAIMLDTKGPDITTGKFENGMAFLKQGDKIRIYRDELLGDCTKFSTSYPNIVDELDIDSIVKINDGLLELKVVGLSEDSLICEVVTGGCIYDNKGINIIGQRLKVPFLTEKDKNDIDYACKQKVDLLALSFISSSEEILEVNDILINNKNDNIRIIAKIENERALDDIEEIIKVSDAIMVARGDLGVELPLEKLPGIQKNIINKCHEYGKVSIIATEMMSSMETSIRPTRAEVSDVANAVIDGVDAVMLSGETTVGKCPVSALSMMYKIIESAEEDINYYSMTDKAMSTEKQDITSSIAYSVVDSSHRLKIKTIVTPTMSGYTAKKISRFRPICPIIALSPDKNVVMELSMYYGIYAYLIEEVSSFDKMMDLCKKIAKEKCDVYSSDKIIITGGYPFKNSNHTNFMKIEEL